VSETTDNQVAEDRKFLALALQTMCDMFGVDYDQTVVALILLLLKDGGSGLT
jgi:hypothetical protein